MTFCFPTHHGLGTATRRGEALEGLAVEPEGMIGDVHGTPEYRAHLVKVMTARAVTAANT